MEEKIKIYNELILRCQRFERNGKVVLYTTANGHVFSIFNKQGEIGIRFSRKIQKKYLKKFKTTMFKSFNSVMTGYVLIPESMWEDLDSLAKYLNESYDYVMSLPPK